MKIFGISRGSAQSHREFINKHGLSNITLLTDEKGKIATLYDADHWLLPVSRRVYLLVDPALNIVFRKDTGFSLLDDQTQTLVREIEKNLPSKR